MHQNSVGLNGDPYGTTGRQELLIALQDNALGQKAEAVTGREQGEVRELQHPICHAAIS